MVKLNLKFVVWGLISSLFLTACVWPQNEDPFERLPSEPVETIDGIVFPFSVSVSTRATHRLEKDEKLQAYMASDILRLEDFEGREVEVDGIFRNEKMRQIFWVEAIRLTDTQDPIEDPIEDNVFETKRFLFVFPPEWEYTTAPNGTAYFLDSQDPARRVFLTFEVQDLTDKDKKIDPNILISNLAGTKSVTQDSLGRDREKITLFSNLNDKKYVFTFTHQFEEFEKKKSFFRLLNSFLEGAEAIEEYRSQKLQEKANKEAALAKETQKPALPEKTTDNAAKPGDASEEEPTGFLDRIFNTDQNAPETTLEADSNSKPSRYKNLIDNRAFNYQSNHYQLNLKVPFGFWFQNFGASPDSVTEIGFASNPINNKNDISFWMRLENTSEPATTTQETESPYGLEITAPHHTGKLIRMTGPEIYRDAMWSIINSVQ